MGKSRFSEGGKDMARDLAKDIDVGPIWAQHLAGMKRAVAKALATEVEQLPEAPQPRKAALEELTAERDVMLHLLEKCDIGMTKKLEAISEADSLDDMEKAVKKLIADLESLEHVSNQSARTAKSFLKIIIGLDALIEKSLLQLRKTEKEVQRMQKIMANSRQSDTSAGEEQKSGSTRPKLQRTK